ncbi:MAG: isoprenylcysteine carboxylmethyltransferase family protein [Polyangiaceae bacterium]|nr:isoprenylcysteine carboxylmethyltransferase family protein [Polyangiaceae bacterium]
MDRLRRVLPVLLPGVLLGASIALGCSATVRAPRDLRPIALGCLVLYLGLILVEGATASRRETSLPVATEDRGTFELYALAQGASALAALGFGYRWSAAPPWTAGLAVAGSVILLAGIAFRLGAVFTLGRWYSRRVRLLEAHPVIQTGPYRFVRHPAYLGNLTVHVGLSLAYESIPGVLLVCFAPLPCLVRRIRREEVVLDQLGGYAPYAARTARLVPGVWQAALQ